MQLAGIDEHELTEMVANRLAEKLFPQLHDLVTKYETPDELLTGQEICNQVLHCSTNTLTSYFLYQPGFPTILKGSQRVYSRKAVEKWIAEHQQYS